MPAADLTGRDRTQVEQAAGLPEQDTLDAFDGRGSACGIETIERFLVQYVVTIRLERGDGSIEVNGVEAQVVHGGVTP